jgi:hypothetical protein
MRLNIMEKKISSKFYNWLSNNCNEIIQPVKF